MVLKHCSYLRPYCCYYGDLRWLRWQSFASACLCVYTAPHQSAGSKSWAEQNLSRSEKKVCLEMSWIHSLWENEIFLSSPAEKKVISPCVVIGNPVQSCRTRQVFRDTGEGRLLALRPQHDRHLIISLVLQDNISISLGTVFFFASKRSVPSLFPL